MTQEISKSLIPFEVGITGVDVYHGQSDPDQKALVLNSQIVQIEGDGKATPGAMNVLAILYRDETSLSPEYRPPVIRGLSHDNLVAVANSLTEEEELDPLILAIKRIEKAAQGEWEENHSEKSEKDFFADVFDELAERLLESTMDDEERARFVAAIDDLVSLGLLDLLEEKRPDLLVLLYEHREEFNNGVLRRELTRRTTRVGI